MTNDGPTGSIAEGMRLSLLMHIILGRTPSPQDMREFPQTNFLPRELVDFLVQLHIALRFTDHVEYPHIQVVMGAREDELSVRVSVESNVLLEWLLRAFRESSLVDVRSQQDLSSEDSTGGDVRFTVPGAVTRVIRG
jgi:hypothetical protein